ncbi:Osmosensitive K channel His kinase sensor [Gloeothece citriformis PCC 7424]|uniref:Osmosensitive K channel His kinase sensor n=1 Tax=Gloeothece citriformis (strain PCC 7424) TaxID=65393 RepID=B7KBV1_GLOC7|nr:universal stress protein [Gloeothece citriformis]ACK73079.1 Osmosensitive K channel His kinase sensor [Gloeothece citriformis PCC 7424]
MNSTPYESLNKSESGKHRIYIGMAPGVGKTYRMLQEANSLREEGIDVVIGLLETHGREETAEQVERLEQVPLKEITYQGKPLKEMDVEAIITRQPQIVLVDELAHTNIPGSLREKRYQDVEFLLNLGINVFSTVNIQHFESLNDVVAKITGVLVRERIPDRLLDEADEVIVVDATPEILQERLIEGKIYKPEKIEQSLRNFFQRRNLVALRELALREVANNIEEIEELEGEGNYCCVQERVLVCLSTYSQSSRLLRRGARLANQMKARLYALFVEDPERFLSKDEIFYLEWCQQLCQDFGGEFLRVTHPDVAKAIAEVAEQHHITQVVIGQSLKSRWNLLLKGSIVQRLMRYLKEVDLHIIATTFVTIFYVHKFLLF